jgi:hypothetical protein
MRRKALRAAGSSDQLHPCAPPGPSGVPLAEAVPVLDPAASVASWAIIDVLEGEDQPAPLQTPDRASDLGVLVLVVIKVAPVVAKIGTELVDRQPMIRRRLQRADDLPLPLTKTSTHDLSLLGRGYT